VEVIERPGRPKAERPLIPLVTLSFSRRNGLESIARFETLTRIGFAARGITYILVGWLAIEAGRATGASGALASLA
jgi:hypothetical protein